MGDPHVITFDGLYYDIFTSGTFIYVRNLSYVPIEVSSAPCDTLILSFMRETEVDSIEFDFIRHCIVV